jgi:carboxypeptidase Taq
VHWYSGSFGYFPTYTIGAVMAAQLFGAVKQKYPEVVAAIARGDFAPLLTWLRMNVHGRGRLVDMNQMLLDATGAPLRTQAFMAHLQARYGGA